MPEIKLPPTLAVVVESEVLGATAISVPAREYRHIDQDEAVLLLSVDRPEIEDEIDRRETTYLDSLEAPEDVQIDRRALAQAAELAVNQGNLTWDRIAADCGWTKLDKNYNGGRRGNGQKVRELLGLASGNNSVSRNLTYDEANSLVKAIGLDPVDIGL